MNSQSTQNLIGFLAKKSLFKNDNKQKQTTFSDAISNDALSRSITPKTKNQSRSQISQLNVFRDASQKQLHRKGISELEKPSRALTNTLIKPQQEHRFEKIKTNDIYFSHVKQNTKQQNPETSNFFKSNNDKNKNLFIGFGSSPQKTQAKTFESLQLEAERCLGEMSFRLSEQIQSINEKIDFFNSKMLKMLNSELESLRYKILSMVDEVFQESQKSIRIQIKQQQTAMFQDVFTIKTQLEKQYSKITEMNQKIRTNEWRKIAAEMIGNDLENHVETLIDKAQMIELKLPEVNHQQKNDKLNEFCRVLKEIVHVKGYLKN